MTRQRWTPEQIATAVRMRDEGRSHATIGRAVGGRTRGAVHALVHRLRAKADGEVAPAEPLSVSKPVVDPRVVVSELEQARAALVRAERRYAEVMEPIHRVVRGAMEAVRLPMVNLDEPDRDLAEDLCAALREAGYVVVEASRA